MKHFYLFLLFSFGITLSIQAQNLQRVRTFGGLGEEWIISSTVDSQGSLYSVGYFNSQGFADFNPGVDTFSLLSSGFDGFIVKIDSLGDFVWAKQLGGLNNQYFSQIAYDGTDAIYISGTYTGTVDFDFGSGVHNLNSSAVMPFLLKLDTAGNFVWVKEMPVSIYHLEVDSSKNIYTSGYFTGTVDFDPGVTTYNLIANSNQAYIQKLDSNGNFIWAGQISSTTDHTIDGFTVGENGNVYLSGRLNGGSMDIDPGVGNYMLNAIGLEDGFVIKINSSGGLEWGKVFGSSYGACQGKDIAIDKSGNVYTVGWFLYTIDFDPGPGVAILSTGFNDNFDAFINKLDSNGNFVWVKRVGNIQEDEEARQIGIDQNNNVVISGTYSGIVDFDPGPGVNELDYSGDNFLLKLDSAGAFNWAENLGIGIIRGFSLGKGEYINVIGSYNSTLSNGIFQPYNFDPQGTNFSQYTLYGNADPLKTDLFISYYSPQPTNILPVQLTQFTATPKQKEILLEWQTASEIHSDYFTVERSKDAKSWAELTRVKAAGSSSFTKDYNTIDEHPYSGTSYYRLKQVDLDGSFAYSPVRTVNFGYSKGQVSVYPNPATDRISLSTSNEVIASDIRMYNSTGQDVTGQIAIRHIGAGSYQIDIAKLVAGTYILSSGAAGKTMITKL